MADLCFLPATDLARRIRAGDLSSQEVMAAHLARTADLNPRLNAIVTLVADEARAAARRADEVLSSRGPVGPLHGLPVAHKDLVPTKGIRTTFGSPLFASNVPARNAIIVDRLQAAGAITVGKTNTPEFGAGSQTFNTIFGVTRNPYDPSKTCGGSSGGSAVALASGMVSLADGTDMGGSLRNPASFCNVVGFRPSPGLVPVWPRRIAWFPSPSVSGPMGRTVADVALMLGVMAGPDARDPLSVDRQPLTTHPLDRDLSGARVAWSRDLGGLPMDPRVTEVLAERRSVFDSLGCIVEDAMPDLHDADEIFRTWRAWYFELAFGEMLDTDRAALKDTVIWNIEAGRQLTGPQLGRMARLLGALHDRVCEFMTAYEYMVVPATQVPPFDVTEPFVKEIAGVQMDSYLDWMRSCYYISVTGLPAISVPCGFTPEGLPVGIQIVGRHGHDLSVLQLAHAFEQATGCWRRHPPMISDAPSEPSTPPET